MAKGEISLDNYKTCKTCKISKIDKDYFLGNESCYKCVYEMKKKIRDERRKCVHCDNSVPPERSKYCGKECAKKAKKANAYWTYKVKLPNDAWWKNKRFIFR